MSRELEALERATDTDCEHDSLLRCPSAGAPETVSCGD